MELRGHRAVMLNPYTLQSRELAGRIDRLYIGSVQKAPSFFVPGKAAGSPRDSLLYFCGCCGRITALRLSLLTVPISRYYMRAEQHLEASTEKYEPSLAG